MNLERLMLVESVLEGKLASDILTQNDLDQYQYMLDTKSFFFTIAEKFDQNPAMTFSEVYMGLMN